jgi:hypothetical protein
VRRIELETAMPLIVGSNLAKSFGANAVFGGVTFSVPHGAPLPAHAVPRERRGDSGRVLHGPLSLTRESGE